MVVIVLLVVIWAVVLVPPALRSHAARKEAFLISFGPGVEAATPRPAGSRSPRIQRRRRIAGGLAVATVATLLMGLLPTFRVLLVVHLFLVDSFLAYIALLAHMANRSARSGSVAPVLAERPAPARPARRWQPRRVVRPAVLPELGPAPVG